LDEELEKFNMVMS
jgi:hypothetical protein